MTAHWIEQRETQSVQFEDDQENAPAVKVANFELPHQTLSVIYSPHPNIMHLFAKTLPENRKQLSESPGVYGCMVLGVRSCLWSNSLSECDEHCIYLFWRTRQTVQIEGSGKVGVTLRTVWNAERAEVPLSYCIYNLFFCDSLSSMQIIFLRTPGLQSAGCQAPLIT